MTKALVTDVSPNRDQTLNGKKGQKKDKFEKKKCFGGRKSEGERSGNKG